MSEPTREQPAVTPEVTTAPAGSVWRRIPDHLGRARTSTVVLVVLFLAIGTLYLNIRPETTGTATTGTGNEAPVQTTTPVPATTTTPAPETTEESRVPTEETPTTDLPTDTTTPEGTTSSVPSPTTAESTPSSTAGSPTG